MSKNSKRGREPHGFMGATAFQAEGITSAQIFLWERGVRKGGQRDEMGQTGQVMKYHVGY